MFFDGKLVMAAATENNDNSEDDDPGAVIVEKIAKTVVIHNMFLQSMFAILHRSFTYYDPHRLRDTKIKGTVIRAENDSLAVPFFTSIL